MGTSVYIHIPYCRSKCLYCDFLSFAESAQPLAPAAYLKALEQELILRGLELRRADRTVSTLYIGGGTPTSLDTSALETLLAACTRHLPLDTPEWSVEANPGTLSAETIRILAQSGVNRVSIGVQDLHEQRLAMLGRAHNALQAEQAFFLCRDSFPVVSVDIMAALPGQTMESLLHSLETVCGWGPRHVSVYGLKTEEGTPLAGLVEAGQLSLPGDDETLAMFIAGRDFLLGQGFEHYEVANFAKPGYRCRHNLTYWHNEPYLGLGLGAHSYWGGKRLVNVRSASHYQHALQAGCLPVEEVQSVTEREEMEDTMMLGLRLTEGVSYSRFFQRFGQDLRQVFAREISHLKALGLIVSDEMGIRLSESGLPVANFVFGEFITA